MSTSTWSNTPTGPDLRALPPGPGRARVPRLARRRHRRPGLSPGGRGRAADAPRLGRARGAPITIRLVKGAYWDYEVLHARRLGWPEPVYLEKWQSDASFERCTRFLLEHHEQLRPAFGSHNVRSLAHAIAAAEAMGLPPVGLRAADAPRHGRRRSRARWSTAAIGSGSTRPTARCCRGWPTWSAGCWRTRRTSRSSRRASAAHARIDDLLRDPEEIGAMLTADATARRPIGAAAARRAAAVPQRAADRLRPGREPRGDARGARRGPRPARPAIPADHRGPGGRHRPATARLARSRPQLAGRRPSRRWPTAEHADGRSPPRGRPCRPGRRPPARDRAAVLVRAADDHPRAPVRAGRVGGLRVRQALGARPTATSPRRSTSASSTPAR